MSIFWLGACVLLLAGLCLISLPWWANSKGKRQDTLTNTSLIRQRLGELQREEQEGLLSSTDRQETEQDLKMALLDEVAQGQTSAASARGILVGGLALSLIAVGAVYWQSNNVQALQNWQQTMEKLPDLATRIVSEGDDSIDIQDMREFALGLRTTLRNKPDDVTAWTLLGRVYSANNDIESALQAFDKALELAPDKIDTLANYSQTLLMINQPAYLQQARQMLQHLLTLDPQNTGAVGMLAMVATQLGDQVLALKSWRRLQQFVPPSDPIYQSIEQQITKLTATQASGNTGKQSIGSPAVSATGLNIEVTLAEALQARLPKSGYLFVYAQDASSSSKMPAAVTKMPLPGLPIKVQLSDANSVMPTLTLSKLSEARVIARISANEDVSQSQGDLLGKVTVELKDNAIVAVTIIIDEEVL
ncbi:MAG: cytochrome c-type biogenesis protein CcmI [Paraglaciecola sp.]